MDLIKEHQIIKKKHELQEGLQCRLKNYRRKYAFLLRQTDIQKEQL